MIANLLAKDLLKNGIEVLFGVQGGACARLIDAFVLSGGTYVPVFNEQSAGYAAHGYFLHTGKIAGVVVTTGPGLTNVVSGIASCYYDSVPLLVLVGQIKSSLNQAKIYDTKMVGFQELPHLDIVDPISDVVTDIRSLEDYTSKRMGIFKKLKHDQSVVVLEIQDDVQRFSVGGDTEVFELVNKNDNPDDSEINLEGGNPLDVDLIILGSGCRHLSEFSINKLNASGVPVVLTWGAQFLYDKITNCKGIFGTHSPGQGNDLLRRSRLPLVIGCSLLQHQIGRDQKLFIPNSIQINYVNKSSSECLRLESQFQHAKTMVMDSNKFLQLHHLNMHPLLPEIKSYDANFSIESNKFHPVSILRCVFESFINYGNTAYSDAGATLSWSYQAINHPKFFNKNIDLYTSYNLHPMGFSNCALFGGGIEAVNEKILAIIGDGSLMMNCQELPMLLNNKNLKLVVIDNRGYGIIRMTQDDYYDHRYFGSDLSSLAPLKHYDVAKVVSGFGLSAVRLSAEDVNNHTINEFFLGDANVCIVDVDPSSNLTTDFYK